MFRHDYALPSARDAEGREVAAVRGVIASRRALLRDGATHIGVALWPGYKTGAGIAPGRRCGRRFSRVGRAGAQNRLRPCSPNMDTSKRSRPIRATGATWRRSTGRGNSASCRSSSIALFRCAGVSRVIGQRFGLAHREKRYDVPCVVDADEDQKHHCCSGCVKRSRWVCMHRERSGDDRRVCYERQQDVPGPILSIGPIRLQLRCSSRDVHDVPT